MNGQFLEILRAAKWTAFPWAARLRASVPIGRLNSPVTFLIGCGRSGTTALGQALARHRGVTYLNEPLHYWYAIDSRTDSLNFFGGRGQCFFDATHATAQSRQRFTRLFGQAQLMSRGREVVEKLPANPLRMAWLNELCPTAKFVHIIRDSRFVCRSIEEISRTNRYRVPGKSGLHQWWGRQFHKWNSLVRECRERGLCTESFDSIPEQTPWAYSAMAALEWLVKLRQARVTAAALGLGEDRFIEVRYEDLVANPAEPLERIEQLIGLPHDSKMIDEARIALEPRKWRTPDMPLPTPLYYEIMHEQERLGYPTAGIRLLAPSICTAS